MWMPHCQMTTTPRTHTHMHQCGQPPVTDFQFICLDAAKSTQHNDPFDRIVNRELHYFSLLFFVALRTLPEQLWQIDCVDRRPQPDLMQEERERAKKQEKHSAYASILIPFIGCVSNRNGDVFIAFLHFHMFFFLLPILVCNLISSILPSEATENKNARITACIDQRIRAVMKCLSGTDYI